MPNELRNVATAPIRLKRQAVIGTNAVIFPSVTIGEGAIIGALSLVREDVPDWSIYAGIPAKRIGTRRKDLLTLLASEALQES